MLQLRWCSGLYAYAFQSKFIFLQLMSANWRSQRDRRTLSPVSYSYTLPLFSLCSWIKSLVFHIPIPCCLHERGCRTRGFAGASPEPLVCATASDPLGLGRKSISWALTSCGSVGSLCFCRKLSGAAFFMIPRIGMAFVGPCIVVMQSKWFEKDGKRWQWGSRMRQWIWWFLVCLFRFAFFQLFWHEFSTETNTF